MPIPMDAPIPPALELSGSYTLRFTALDPVSGAVNTSVVISGATVQYEDVSPSQSTTVPEPILVPTTSSV